MQSATPDSPLRVAIVGSGPSAFYAAEALQKTPDLNARIDMFDRLPMPFGLVRGGVAPDHQNIKAVVKVYEKIAAHPGFRFFGNVTFGKDLSYDDLAGRYHQIVFATGSPSDARLGVPGEDQAGVFSATEFVGWYNGHPDFTDRRFDLAAARRVAIVGNGNVAMDVARLLLKDPAALTATDLDDAALATLRTSKVEEVVLLGRRGPAQAAFSPKELEEIAELPRLDVVVSKAEAEPDPLSLQWLEREGSRSSKRSVELVRGFAAAPTQHGGKRLTLRFCVAPIEVLGKNGRVTGVRLQHAVLEASASGAMRPKPIDRYENLDVDLVFRAIGYRGVPLPAVPFDPKSATIPNQDGRVQESAGGPVRRGCYVVGWAKRGPTGLIGTNSPDAKATVTAMLADRASGALLTPAPGDVADLLRERKVEVVTWQDWQRLDAWEREQGTKRGKVRHKLSSIQEALRVVHEVRAKR